MLLSPEFVLVKEIKSDVPRSSFSEEALERMALLILQLEGLIRPILIKPIDWEEYKIIDGHFEYWASVKAKEMDGRNAERLIAFILEGDKAEAMEQQLTLYRQEQIPQSKPQKKTPKKRGMQYRTFLKNFQAFYTKTRLYQEVNGTGVVCIRSADICKNFIEQFSSQINKQQMDKYFSRLKSEGYVLAVIENNHELITWKH